MRPPKANDTLSGSSNQICSYHVLRKYKYSIYILVANPILVIRHVIHKPLCDLTVSRAYSYQ